ncbi:MAG: hypothetical protein GY947_08845 [Rhodobacteraceae bacterium]|nr:hypothetical protein [Paracoccaceae bacterium]
MKDEEESLDNPEIGAEYEAWLDGKLEPLAQDFESWKSQTGERLNDLEEQQAETQDTSQKQRPF